MKREKWSISVSKMRDQLYSCKPTGYYTILVGPITAQDSKFVARELLAVVKCAGKIKCTKTFIYFIDGIFCKYFAFSVINFY